MGGLRMFAPQNPEVSFFSHVSGRICPMERGILLDALTGQACKRTDVLVDGPLCSHKFTQWKLR